MCVFQLHYDYDIRSYHVVFAWFQNKKLSRTTFWDEGQSLKIIDHFRLLGYSIPKEIEKIVGLKALIIQNGCEDKHRLMKSMKMWF